MSYLFIAAIGAVAGFIVGQYMKGGDHGAGVDALAGGVGALVAVVLSRVLGPAAAAGFLISAVIAAIGAVAALYGTRQFLKPKPVPVSRPRRR